MYERRGGGRFGGGGRDYNEFDKPKPVKIGEEYDVKITDVGARGDGITKIENFIVFVAGTKKGESCRIKIKEVSSRFAVGEKVGEPSGEAAATTEEAAPSEETEESAAETEESEGMEETESEGEEDKEE